MIKLFGMIAAVLIACGFATPGFADTVTGTVDTFLLTSCHITGASCNGGSVSNADAFGSVVLTQSGTNVGVSVTLNNGDRFVETGAGGGDLFDFNDTFAGSTITGITTTLNGVPTALAASGFTNLAPFQADGFGDFTADVQCTTASQCNGGSTPNINDLHFTVTNISLAQIETKNADGVFFLADILCGPSQPGCTGGLTGPVDASARFSSVPGPIVGAGLPGIVAMLFGGGGLWWRRKRQVA